MCEGVIFKILLSTEYVMESISKGLIQKCSILGVYSIVYVLGGKFMDSPIWYVPVSMTLWDIQKNIPRE